jgi:hypothetical protein
VFFRRVPEGIRENASFVFFVFDIFRNARTKHAYLWQHVPTKLKKDRDFLVDIARYVDPSVIFEKDDLKDPFLMSRVARVTHRIHDLLQIEVLTHPVYLHCGIQGNKHLVCHPEQFLQWSKKLNKSPRSLGWISFGNSFHGPENATRCLPREWEIERIIELAENAYGRPRIYANFADHEEVLLAVMPHATRHEDMTETFFTFSDLFQKKKTLLLDFMKQTNEEVLITWLYHFPKDLCRDRWVLLQIGIYFGHLLHHVFQRSSVRPSRSVWTDQIHKPDVTQGTEFLVRFFHRFEFSHGLPKDNSWHYVIL